MSLSEANIWYDLTKRNKYISIENGLSFNFIHYRRMFYFLRTFLADSLNNVPRKLYPERM